MPRTELERHVQPSLLDRLTDETPDAAGDPSTTREDSVRRFRAAVQRDVERLLNSRRTTVPAGSGRPLLAVSVHQYGLPDLFAIAPGTPEGQETLTREVRETIARFEPRLANVVVRLVENDQRTAPQVRFVVEGTLRMDPSPELVVFDTVVELSSGDVDVGTPR
jgi:type VI secretion system protein ImpF